MYLVDLVPQTVPLHAVPVARLLRVRQLQSQVADLVVPLVQGTLLLQADALHDLVVAFLSLLPLRLQSLLQALDLSKVLSFFQKHFIALLVRLLDLLFRLLSQKLDRALFLLVKGDFLLLVLEKLDEVLVFTRARIQLLGDNTEFISRL